MLVEIAAIIIAHAAAKPVRWLIGLSIIGELLTTLPFGTITIAIFLPLIVKRFFRRAWVIIAIILQLVMMLGIMWFYGR